MAIRFTFVCATAIALLGCGAGPDDTGSESVPAIDDPDGKADSIASGLLSTTVVNGAKSRIFAKLRKVPNSTLSSLLVAAAKRGVDVEIYLVYERPGSADAVLASQHLEASGVHVIVDRSDNCAFDAVVDNQLRTVKSSGSISTSKTASKVNAAVDAFQAVLHREPSATKRTIKSGTVRLRVMPDDTGSEIQELIAGAASSIDLEIYQVEDPAITSALTAAASRGVRVRVMLEPKTVGARNYDLEKAALEAAGVQVQPTPPAFDSSHNVDHAKFMLIDGKGLAYATGNLVCSGQGGNPAAEFNNRDYWIEDGRSASVTEGKALFEADWARNDSTSITFANLVVTPDNADERVLALIDGAHAKLYVENQSLNDDTVIQHLISAKKRGVDVRVLLGLQPGFGGQPPANQAAIDALSKAGIPAGFFSKHYLHAKLVIADDEAFLGSQNFTAGGLSQNRELGGIVGDATNVGALEQVFLADQAEPTP